MSFEHLGIDYKKHVVFDQKYLRPNEVEALVGNPQKAEKILGWKAKTYWQELSKILIDADFKMENKVRTN
jgi:GDPmannose 4,6-dehydratase